jgi:calcineurin-like phosphoesterase family protein
MSKIEPCDILIFAGDCMNSGHNKRVLLDFLEWFSTQPAVHKVMIAGNHDRWIENHPGEFKELLEDYDIIYLEDSGVTLEGLKIYGTPHSRHFGNWAFNRTEDEMMYQFSRIPLDTQILISHAPQHNKLDSLVEGIAVGELELTKRIEHLHDLQLHVFGHIHNGFGMIKEDGDFHISVNASQVDETYSVVNFPIKVEL